jgi:hypothetical protein
VLLYIIRQLIQSIINQIKPFLVLLHTHNYWFHLQPLFINKDSFFHKQVPDGTMYLVRSPFFFFLPAATTTYISFQFSYVLVIVFTHFILNPQSSKTRIKNLTHFYTFHKSILSSGTSTDLKRIINTCQQNTSKLMAPFS